MGIRPKHHDTSSFYLNLALNLLFSKFLQQQFVATFAFNFLLIKDFPIKMTLLQQEINNNLIFYIRCGRYFHIPLIDFNCQCSPISCIQNHILKYYSFLFIIIFSNFNFLRLPIPLFLTLYHNSNNTLWLIFILK